MKQARRGKAARHGRNNRRRGAGRNNRIVLTAFCWALALIMLGLGAYSALWYLNRGRINRESERYAGLYGGRLTGAPTGGTAISLNVTQVPGDAGLPTPIPTPTAVPAVSHAETPTPVPTKEPVRRPTPITTAGSTEKMSPASTAETAQSPSPVPDAETIQGPSPIPKVEMTQGPSPVPTAETRSVPTAEPTPVPTEKPTPVSASNPKPDPTVESAVELTSGPSPALFGADMPVAEDVPIPTPGSDTLVYALPTAPPVQSSFDALLALNPETVGFLEIEGMLALPVAQRENDNEYYLSHTFEGMESSEGALFLDGMNRLVPEDDCLILYGHNMKNKTMFGKLSAYEDIAFLRHHSVIRFDTLYENRCYVIFAGFVASMKPGDPRYFDVRHFIFDDVEFDKFVLKLQSRSMFKSPIEVAYGDRLLLLVTCDYTRNEGRLILALRQLREGENENDVWAKAMRTEMK